MPVAPDVSDEAIVALVLAGDREQFGVLVVRYQARLVNSLRLVSGDAELARDLTQEAFYRAYAALGRFNPEYRFSSWLYQIALNLWRTSARRGSRETHLEDQMRTDDEDLTESSSLLVDADLGPEARAVAKETKSRLWAAVDQLPSDHRQIVVMRHVMELSYQEIGERLGLPMGTVKSRLARARAELAAALSDD